MIKITKTEAFAMREICGQQAVKKTYSKHPTYYLVEDKRFLSELRKYRQSLTNKN
jgi:hypothetical protein